MQQLWVGYLAVGGSRDAFEIEAYLHGLAPLSDDQQDILATVVNERLDDLYRTACVPYCQRPGDSAHLVTWSVSPAAARTP